MEKKLFITVLILSMLVIPQIAASAGMEIAVGLWYQEPSGNMGYKGESLSVEKELKYDDETKPYGRLKINTPLALPNIYLMATPMEYEGNGEKNVNFTFGDVTFNGSVPFDSKVKLDHYDIGLYYGLPFIKTLTLNMLNVDVGIDARIIDFKAEINQQSTSRKESKSLTFVVPMGYAAAQFKPAKWISIEAEGRGVSYDNNHYYDLIGRVKVNPVGPMFIAGGYRFQEMKIDDSDIKAKIKVKGPFVETGVEF
jgi:outer membrane protein